MADQPPIYEVTIPNGAIVEVSGAPSLRAAQERASQIFQRDFPDEFAAWRQSLPLPGFFGGAAQQFRGALGSQATGLGIQAEERGVPGGETLRNIGQTISGQPSLGERQFENFSDFLTELRRRPLEVIPSAAGQALGAVTGSLALPVAAALGASAVGAAAPAVAAVGTGAAILGGALSSSTELEQILRNEQVPPDQARALAANIGPVIGAMEGGAAAILLRRVLGREIRQETAEQLARVAGRSRTGAAAREGAVAAGLEGGSEALGGAARQAVAAAETGNLNLGERIDQVALDALLGVIGGGAVGGVAGVRAPGAARAELAAREAAAAPPPAPPAAPTEPPIQPLPNIPAEFYEIPPEPAPFTDPAQAREFLTRTDIAEEFRPAFDIGDAEAITLANAAQQRTYQGAVENRRQTILSRFLEEPAVRRFEEPGPTPESPPVQREVRDIQAVRLQQRLTQLASRPENEIDIENIDPKQVAQVAFRLFTGAEQTPTAADITRVRQQFENLRQQGFFEKGSERGTYRFAPRDIEAIDQRRRELQQRKQQQPGAPTPTVETRPADWQAEQPAPQPVVPLTPEQEARRREAEETFTRANPEAVVQQIMNDDQFARNFFNTRFSQLSKPGISSNIITNLFRREGLILDQPQATDLYKRARQIGVISPVGEFIPPNRQAPITIPTTTPAPPPVTPQQQQPQPEPIAGFTTAKGSTYQINEFGQTIRTKKSPGRGQGETYAPHNVLFVQPNEAESILQDMQGGGTYRFIVDDPAGPRRLEADENLVGKRVALAVFRPDGTLSRYVPAQTTPAVGLSPVELRVEGTGANRISRRHIGNVITELFNAPPTTPPKKKVTKAPKKPVATKTPKAPEPTTTPTLGLRPLPADLTTLPLQLERLYREVESGKARVIFRSGDIGLVMRINSVIGTTVSYKFVPFNDNPAQAFYVRTADIDRPSIRDYVPELNNEQIAQLRQAASDFLRADQNALTQNRAGPFASGPLVISKNVPDDIAGYATQLIDSLGLGNTRIMLITTGDANLNTMADNGLADIYRDAVIVAENNIAEKGGAFGITYSNYANNFFVVGIKEGMRPELQFETVAHELGHVFEKAAYRNADSKTKAAIQSAYNKWYAKNKGGTAVDLVESTRLFQTAQELTKQLPQNIKATDLNLYNYLTSFNEWFADQVGRWATTTEQPLTLVDKFFKKVADAYRAIVNSLTGRLAADPSVVEFINSYANGQYKNPLQPSNGDVASSANAGLAPTVELQATVGTPAAINAVNKATRDYITGPLRWFASPIMTIGKTRPAIRPASLVQEAVLNRKNTASIELENHVEKFAKLSEPEQRIVTKAWATASRTKSAPVTTGMSTAQIEALNDLIAGGQRAFDWLIESYVLEDFNPAAKTNPAEKARLEAFREKNVGKHLWEIPDAELRAASPQGYAKMQEMQRLRNPYYMPMIATGSHFLGVYKRDAKGNKVGRPVAMISFTPLNFAQRRRGFADPEAEARAELLRQYPDANRFAISPQAVEFTADEDARNLRGQGDFIAEYLQRLANIPKIASSREAQNLIGSMLRTLDKAQLARVFRPNQDILQAVTPANEGSYVLDNVPRYFLGVANIAARRATQGDWARALEGLSRNDKEYLNNLRDYSTTPTEAFSGARTAAFFMLLGGALDTALLNSLQVLQTTIPMMIRDGGVGTTKHLLPAYNLAIRNLIPSMRGGRDVADQIARTITNPQERADFERALKMGIFQPLYTNESRGQVTVEGLSRAGVKDAAAWSKRFNTWARILGKFQQNAEQVNRAVTFLAALRAARENPGIIAKANKYDGTNFGGAAAAFDYAVGKVFDTQFTTTKEDRAYFQRFTPGAELATQFMSFPVKMFEQFARHFLMTTEGLRKADPDMAKAGAIGFLGMAAPIVALAGVWALPGADFLRELLERIIKEVWGDPTNFDADMRRYFGGERLAEAVSRGLPHAFGSAALTRRLAIDPVPFNDLASAQTLTLFGPFGSILESPFKAYEALKRGDYWDAAVALSPRALGNIIRGADIEFGTGEVRSQRGNTLVTPEQIAAIDRQHLVPISVRTALGFQSPAVVSLREGMARAEEIQRQNRKPQERLNQELAGYIADIYRAGQTGNSQDMARAYDRFNKRVTEVLTENERQFNAGRQDRMLNMDMDSLQRQGQAEYYGRTSPEAISRMGSARQRPYIADEVSLYNWRPYTQQQQ